MSTEVRKGYSQNARRILSSFCLCRNEDFDIIDETIVKCQEYRETSLACPG